MSTPSHLRIGTRGSQLALTQTGWFESLLRRLHPGLTTELIVVQTSGDRITHRPLADIGGKGLFVKELDEALLDERIDCAVHSMKDLPGILAPGVVLAAVPEREDPRDVFITRSGEGLGGLPPGSKVGTSSPRRMALLREARPDFAVVHLRGNVDTRLRKLEQREVDATVLARAGLSRLGLAPPHAEPLDPTLFVPAIGQGALAVTCRPGPIADLLSSANHSASRLVTDAERSFLAAMGGSCVTPLAAHGILDGDRILLRALIARPDGCLTVRREAQGAASDGPAIGQTLAEQILAAGGAQILADLGAAR